MTVVTIGAGLALLAIAACSGKPPPEEATRSVQVHDPVRVDDAAEAAPGDATSGAMRDPATGSTTPGRAAAGSTATGSSATGGAATGDAATGDLQVRVAWPDVPAIARSSPGRTPCNTPRAPSAAPTTTWGIPDALVVVEGSARGSPRPVVARITLADCTLTPRIAAATSLAVTSAVDRPARLVLRKRGTLDPRAAGNPIPPIPPMPPVPVMLPIAGHTVTSALDAGAIYSLETDAADPELAFVATLPGGHITDASGHVVVHNLAVGAHAVTAWLPPRAGQPARLARGTARITAGDLTELTITLTLAP